MKPAILRRNIGGICFWAALGGVFPGLVITVGASDSFSDSLAAGLNPDLWLIQSNQSLYATDISPNGLTFSKPTGGDNSFQFIGLFLQAQALSDFDARVDFTNAQIALQNGSPGNQVQLNAGFGGQDFLIVRSDEIGGNTAHVFLNPPASWCGPVPSTASNGTLRITRSESLVQGFFNGTLLCQGTYNTNAATLSLTLHNNGTSDATAVTFQNFSLVATGIQMPPLQLRLSLASSNSIALQFTAGANKGYIIEHRESLSSGTWEALVVMDPVAFVHEVTFTDTITPDTPTRFYRVR